MNPKIQELLQGYNPYNFDQQAPINRLPLIGQARQLLQPIINPNKQTPGQVIGDIRGGNREQLNNLLMSFMPVGSVKALTPKALRAIKAAELSQMEEFYKQAVLRRQTAEKAPKVFSKAQGIVEKHFPDYAMANDQQIGNLFAMAVEDARKQSMGKANTARNLIKKWRNK